MRVQRDIVGDIPVDESCLVVPYLGRSDRHGVEAVVHESKGKSEALARREMMYMK